LPSLKRIIELKRKEAELVGYAESPYDALLDTYEPGLTSTQVSQVFLACYAAIFGSGELIPIFQETFAKSIQLWWRRVAGRAIQGVFSCKCWNSVCSWN
jgi:hypothetical protein